MSTNPPTARTIRISAPDGARRSTAEAIIDLDHGGRLASLRVEGRELLLGPGASERSIGWGSFLMAPWPGRLADGRLHWRGRTWQLPRTHGRHAIHGLIHAVPAMLVTETEDEVRLATELAPLRWPFAGRVRQRLAIEPGRLVVEATIEADEAMPAALGWHPWFDRRGADPRIEVDADRVLVMGGMIPTGATEAVRGRTDLRSGPRLGARRLDHAYDGARSPARIAWPDLEVVLEFEAPLTTVVVHTPAAGFCVEPQTAWPNALGAGLTSGPPGVSGARSSAARPVELEAGEVLTARVAFAWSRPAVRPGS